MSEENRLLKILRFIRRLLIRKTPAEQDLIFKIFSELSDKDSGDRIMIDVGAHYGSSFFNFAKSGWTVYCFEPDDENRAVLINNIKKHQLEKVIVDKRAVSNRETKGKYYESEISSGISSLIKFHSSHKEIKEVEITTLSSFCTHSNIKNIDFLKIDTEGNDLRVIEGLEIQKLRPFFILCEYEDSKTKLVNYTKEDIIKYLENEDYKCIISEWHPIIQYGMQHKWKKITDDISMVDGNSWGNIIAMKPEYYKRFIEIVYEEFRNRNIYLRKGY